MELKQINTTKAPSVLGSYSQGIIADNFVFCSGQIGLNPKTANLVSGGIKSETKQTLKNLQVILRSINLDFSDVVKTEIFLTNIDDFSLVNEIYSSFFEKDPKPARQTVEVSRLPKNALIEISCVALRRKNG